MSGVKPDYMLETLVNVFLLVLIFKKLVTIKHHPMDTEQDNQQERLVSKYCEAQICKKARDWRAF